MTGPPDLPRLRKLRITSEGTTLDTRVVDAETGDMIDGVISATWTIKAPADRFAADWAYLTLVLEGVEIDAIGLLSEAVK